MLSVLNKMRKEGIDTDIVLVFSQAVYPAHRLVLWAASDYFRSVLEHGDDTKIVQMDNITEKCGEIVLEFMYTGQPPDICTMQDKELLREIILAAQYLKLQQLFQFCIHHLADQLSRNNLDQLLQLSEEYRSECFPCPILSHVAMKFGHLYNRQDFLQLTAKQVETILKDPNLNNSEMDDILRVLLEWVKFDEQTREDSFVSLLALLNLGYLSLNSLLNFLWPLHWLNSKDASGTRSSELIEELLLNELISRSESRRTSIEIDRNYENTLFCFCAAGIKQHVELYNINNNRWLQTEPLTFPLRRGMAVVTHSGYIYLIGGIVTDSEGNIKGSNDVMKFSPAINEIVDRGTLRYPVEKASAWVLNGIIYVLDEGESCPSVYKNRIQCYNPVERTSQPFVPASKKLLCRSFQKGNLSYKITCRINYSAFEVIEYNQETEERKEFLCGPPESKFCSWLKATFIDKQIDGYTGAELNPVIEDWCKFSFTSDECTDHDMSDLHQCVTQKKWLAHKLGKPVLLTQNEDSIMHIYDQTASKWNASSERNSGLHIISDAVVLMKPHISFMTASELQQQHEVNMHAFLNNARLNPIFTDCFFPCGSGKLFEAHKIVLSTVSPYFEAMLTSGQRESASGICRVKVMDVTGKEMEVSEKVMDAIVNFLYMKKVCNLNDQFTLPIDEIDFGQWLDMLRVAHMLDVKELVEVCIQRLQDMLNFDNYSQLQCVAKLYNKPGLLDKIQTFLVNNLVKWSRRQKFQDMDLDQLKCILRHPEMTRLSLKDVVRALLNWIKYDYGTRLTEFANLVSLIDVHCTCDDDLDNVYEMISKLKFLIQSPKMQNIMASWRMTFGRPMNHGPKVLLPVIQNSCTRIRIIDIETEKFLADREFDFHIADSINPIAYGGNIFLFSKLADSFKVIRYCPYRNEILSSNVLTIGFEHITGAVGLNGSIYIVGQVAGEFCSTLQCFSPESGEGRVVSHMPKYLAQNMYAWNESLYIISSASGTDSSTFLEKYDTVFDVWSSVTSVPCVAGPHVLTFFDGKLFVLPEHVESNTSKLRVFDLTLGKWAVSHLSQLPDDVEQIFIFRKRGSVHLWVINNHKLIQDIDVAKKRQDRVPVDSVLQYVQNAIQFDSADLTVLTC